MLASDGPCTDFVMEACGGVITGGRATEPQQVSADLIFKPTCTAAHGSPVASKPVAGLRWNRGLQNCRWTIPYMSSEREKGFSLFYTYIWAEQLRLSYVYSCISMQLGSDHFVRMYFLWWQMWCSDGFADLRIEWILYKIFPKSESLSLPICTVADPSPPGPCSKTHACILPRKHGSIQ